MSTETTAIYNKLLENGIDVPLSEIEKAYSILIGYGIPPADATKTILKNFAIKHGITLSSSSKSPLIPVSAIFSLPANEWVSLRVAVINTNSGEKFLQRGVIGDETGTTTFISSRNTSFVLEVGKSYQLDSVTINEFNGQKQISINKNSTATPLTENIEAKPFVTLIEGKIVAISSGSGLIKRCPECNRALTKGACTEHGKVSGIFDLRIKAILDNGEDTYNILIQKDLTEKILGLDQETAISIAADALDQGVIAERIAKLFCNRYYRMQVSPLGTQMLVKEIESLAGPLCNPLEATTLL